jgi:hypothetical protein
MINYLGVMETALPLLLLEGADDAAAELECVLLSAGRFSIPFMGGRSDPPTPPAPPSLPTPSPLPVVLPLPLLTSPSALLVLLEVVEVSS